MTRPSDQPKQYLIRGDLCFTKNNSKVQEVDVSNPTNRRGYTFLGFCEDDIWTAKKCKGVYEHLNHKGYNWYALSHDWINRRPYLGKRVPQVNQYNTQNDRHNIPSPVTPETDKKKLEYQMDYDTDSTNLKPAKEPHSTDDKLKQEKSLDNSII